VTTRALVVGAGPAGLGAAACLARWCDPVTVVEAGSRDRPRRAGEHLPPAGLSELAALGLGELLGDERHDPSPGVRSAWGEELVADREYFTSAPGRGLNLRRELFDEALARHVERQGVVLRFRTRLHELVRDSGVYTATTHGAEGPRALRADVVVDATGRRAAAARRLGATRHRCDQLVGLVGRVEGCAPDAETGRVHVESVEDGWWYGIQFSDGTLLAAFMTDATRVGRHPEHARGLWRERLRESKLLARLAGTGRWSGRLDVFDAATQVLECDPHDGFLAVGDAASAYDPLSSWGITKGLCDGHAGAEALARQRDGDADAVAEHRSRQRRDFEAHRSRQMDFYGAETRWPQSPFWRARQKHRDGGRLERRTRT
jgi:flavin-dependent dehydrogenase